MCRYSDPRYKTSFVCLKHRHVAQFQPGTKPRCPTCRQVMIEMGRDFAAPLKTADNQWRKLELIIRAHGARYFDSCGCDGPGAAPKTFGQAKRWKQENARR